LLKNGKIPAIFEILNEKLMNLTNDIYQRIATAKIFIDENYYESIGLEEISQQAFLSRFHFHRLFTRIYRSTPHRYLTQKRIEKAKQLLAENRAINDVCSEVGFESIGSFSALFKKEIGFAPTYYRNIAWLKKQEQKKQPKKFIPHCFIESYSLDK
jgi:AraC-like DNA-binding protein